MRCGELTQQVLRKEGELAQAKASLEQTIRVRVLQCTLITHPTSHVSKYSSHCVCVSIDLMGLPRALPA